MNHPSVYVLYSWMPPKRKKPWELNSLIDNQFILLGCPLIKYKSYFRPHLVMVDWLLDGFTAGWQYLQAHSWRSSSVENWNTIKADLVLLFYYNGELSDRNGFQSKDSYVSYCQHWYLTRFNSSFDIDLKEVFIISSIISCYFVYIY